MPASRPPTRTAHVPNASLTFREALVALAWPAAVADAELRLAEALAVPAVVLFASARGALSAAIAALAEGAEVALPAYTCAAVANAAISAGKTPVFVDVDSRGLVPADAWPAGLLPIVQDTYGLVADAPKGRMFVRDTAHRAFPVGANGAAITISSFEHSKSLSAGRGGLATIDDPTLAADLRALRDRHNAIPSSLRHAGVTFATIAMGRLDAAGRHLSAELFRKVAWHLAETRLLGQSATELAGRGIDPELLGAPDGRATRLMLSQVRRAAAIASHRLSIVSIYDRLAGLARDSEPLIRYPLTAVDPSAFEHALADSGWDVRGRWFTAPLHPAGSNLAALGYEPGSAPNAERLAATVVNLPTHPLVGDEDARTLMTAALAAGASPLS